MPTTVTFNMKSYAALKVELSGALIKTETCPFCGNSHIHVVDDNFPVKDFGGALVYGHYAAACDNQGNKTATIGFYDVDSSDGYYLYRWETSNETIR